DEYLADFQPDVEPEIFTDFRALIASGQVDAVNDFTTHSLHHQVADAAFAAGKHLLTQKPLAVSMAAGRRMCAAAEVRDVVFGVFENFRQSPATRQLRWLFDESQGGRGGRLQMLLLGYVGLWWAPNLIVADTLWRHSLVEGGGISLDLGVHFFDQIRHVAGEIRTVQAQTAILEPRRYDRNRPGKAEGSIACDADDTFTAAIETASGAIGQLCSSWAGHGAPTLFGEGTVWYGTGGRVGGTTVQLDGQPAQELAALYAANAPAALRQQHFPLGLDNSFALAQHDWLEAIRHRRQPETCGREGLRDLAAAYAILESAQAGRAVEVAEVYDGALREYQRPIDRHFGLV
ncbi:MAG: Gfo/Idh/MocA family oxidoreductase, partial [Planctomycetaceae bacterium]|nr:Gfo/Idh/MocA family oxidoreductase [Planctomycetaceae bacterium]